MPEDHTISAFWLEIGRGERQIPRLVSSFWLGIAAGDDLPEPALVKRSAWHDEFLAEIEAGARISQAADQLGLSRQSVYASLGRDPKFRHEVDQARLAALETELERLGS